MLGGCEGLGEEFGGVGKGVANHGGFERKIALVGFERKGPSESGEVDYTLARDQVVVGFAEVVVEVSGEQAMSLTTQDVEGLSRYELIVSGIVTESDGGRGEFG